ncbi:MAG TPA: zf-TFIIB domain-containing protein [Myxococcaceae bacterium]|nr:zf-TFIIB domain-containing protein [Myxococcaceae bacterium]
MDCPGCNVEMANLEGDDTTLRKCGDCGGLWIDVADLNRVLLHNNLSGLESLGGRAHPEALTGQCPDCHVDLVSVAGGDRRHPQSYDTCESCGGIFLESEFKDATDLNVAYREIVEFFYRFSGRKKTAAMKERVAP